jgi:hypothetical protein
LNSRIWKEMKKGREGELEGRAKEEVEPGESALRLRREIVLLTEEPTGRVVLPAEELTVREEDITEVQTEMKEEMQQEPGARLDPSRKKWGQSVATVRIQINNTPIKITEKRIGQGPTQRIQSEFGGEEIRDILEPIKKMRGRHPGNPNNISTVLARNLSRRTS